MSTASNVETALDDLVKIFLGNNITIGGTVVSTASLLKGLGALGEINWCGVIAAIEAGQWEKEATPIEDILRVVGLFVPPVTIAEADFEALLPIIRFLLANTHYVKVDPNVAKIFPHTSDAPAGLWPSANWKDIPTSG
jgi:hypothetical protein